jgi:hypothetical protein
MAQASKPQANNHWIEIAASFTGRGRKRKIFIYSKPQPDQSDNGAIHTIYAALQRAFHLRWTDSFPLLQDRCTAPNSNEKERNGDSALMLLSHGMTFECEILSQQRSNIELGKLLRDAIVKGKLNELCFTIGPCIHQSKGSRAVKKAALNSAKHWNDVVRFESDKIRNKWLEAEQAHHKIIFSDDIEFDLYCSEFLKHRIAI